ncbi:tetratricopeptide repeat protein [Nonomuraea ceibae]|uniref:tetratricopeptide repeat protein n=1 Tax=Nonomuraea ceibae TaxID=1935170 RepID=UPI001FE308F4|nr:tetratricopeptide repeat protein [Nonomuraea ceibae]
MHEITLDAHRGLLGPYTMAAGLAAALVPGAAPELAAAHDIELRAVAPMLNLPVRRSSLADRLPQEERILIPAPLRTLRLANGVAEFVRDHLEAAGPLKLRVVNLAEADPTDIELLAVLERRVPALTVVREEHGPPHPGPVHRLGPELDRYRNEGFHHAMAEAGAALLPGLPEGGDEWWTLLHRTTTALAALEREDEARDLLDLARRVGHDPKNLATAAYATAMLLVRHHDPARRDPAEAMEWIDRAVALAGSLADPRERAFHLGFDLNGKALVSVRLGRFAQALELVEEALALGERELAPAHPIHRLVLHANRAQLMAQAGRTDEALIGYGTAIAMDPGYPDYYLDRGNLLHKLGRVAEALADYESAMRLGPPFPEPYYNRAEIRFAAGDLAGARADLDHALELDPGFGPAYVNRAGILAGLGEYEAARADVARGLAADPGNAHLLAVLGQVEAARGRPEEALAAYDAALAADPGLAAAWAGRGELAFERGEHHQAVADLTRALQLGETAELLFNRAVAHRAAGRAEQARQDLLRARELAPGDEDIERALAGE